MNQLFKISFDIKQPNGVIIGGDQIYVYTDSKVTAMERGQDLINGLVAQQIPGMIVDIVSISELPQNTVIVTGMGGRCMVPAEEAQLVTLVDNGSKIPN